MIAGVVFGAIAALVIIAAFVILVLRRRQSRNKSGVSCNDMIRCLYTISKTADNFDQVYNHT